VGVCRETTSRAVITYGGAGLLRPTARAASVPVRPASSEPLTVVLSLRHHSWSQTPNGGRRRADSAAGDMLAGTGGRFGVRE